MNWGEKPNENIFLRNTNIIRGNFIIPSERIGKYSYYYYYFWFLVLLPSSSTGPILISPLQNKFQVPTISRIILNPVFAARFSNSNSNNPLFYNSICPKAVKTFVGCSSHDISWTGSIPYLGDYPSILKVIGTDVDFLSVKSFGLPEASANCFASQYQLLSAKRTVQFRWNWFEMQKKRDQFSRVSFFFSLFLGGPIREKWAFL